MANLDDKINFTLVLLRNATAKHQHNRQIDILSRELTGMLFHRTVHLSVELGDYKKIEQVNDEFKIKFLKYLERCTFISKVATTMKNYWHRRERETKDKKRHNEAITEATRNEFVIDKLRSLSLEIGNLIKDIIIPKIKKEIKPDITHVIRYVGEHVSPHLLRHVGSITERLKRADRGSILNVLKDGVSSSFQKEKN